MTSALATGKIVTVHSYRGGTGKSNLTANLAAIMVLDGKRVGVVDTDLQSPGVHVLFGKSSGEITRTLDDFLWGKCTIEEAAYDVTGAIAAGAPGKCWLVPAAMDSGSIARILDEGYDIQRLNSHIHDLLRLLKLDCLLIDSHPGLNRETLLTTAISDGLILILRPDQQDYQGTAVVLEIADKLETPKILLMLNKVYSAASPDLLRKNVEEAFGHDVAAVIPLTEELAQLESSALFVLRHPHHPVTHSIRAVARRILE